MVIVLLTKDANHSSHVQRELHLATEAERRVIPIVIGKFEIDLSLSYCLAGLQVVKLPAVGRGSRPDDVAVAVCRAAGLESQDPKANEQPLVSEDRPRASDATDVHRDLIKVNYMRLFGAIEVPFLMDLIGTEPEFSSWGEDDEDPFYYRVKGDGFVHLAGKRLVSFWKKKWRYKKVRPLLNSLWTDVAADKDAGKRFYWRALSGHPTDIVGYASHQDIDEDGENWSRVAASQRLEITWSELQKTGFTLSKDVGYLFAIFEHVGKNPIYDVALQLDWYANPLGRNRRFADPSPHMRRRIGGSAAAIALKPEQLEKPGVPQILRIASIEPGESFITLLQVYRSDTDQLPEYFVSDCYVPRSWKWEDSSGHHLQQAIRPPFGKTAARIAVPSGWFGQ